MSDQLSDYDNVQRINELFDDSNQSHEPVAIDATAELIARYLDRHIVEIVMDDGSIRLKNVILRAASCGSLPYTTVGDYLRAGSDRSDKLLRLPGMGKKSLDELSNLIEMTASTPSGSSPIAKPIDLNKQFIKEDECKEFPCSRLADMMNSLRDRDNEILSLRYGLNNDRSFTLEEIGTKFDLTRERIRQIESKTLKFLRKKFSTSAHKLLDERAEKIWHLATEGKMAVQYGKEVEILRRFPPEERILLDIGFDSVFDWLASIAKKTRLGWVLKSTETDRIEAIINDINEKITTLNIPCHISEIVIQNIAQQELSAVIEIRGSHTIYCDYLTERPIRKRILRALRAHALLCTRDWRKPIPLVELRDIYRARFQDDFCSGRDLQIVMVNAPHLFLNSYEDGWAALGVGGDIGNFPSAISMTYDHADIEPSDSQSSLQDGAADCLRKILIANGPMQFEVLRNHFVELTKGQYSQASVGPILMMRDDFMRLAPGVYALRQNLDQQEILSHAQKLLLEEKHCELYCRARWAEEPSNLYPLWTPGMEYAWALWTKKMQLGTIHESLLAIATPDLWPISTEEKQRWNQIKRRRGFYHLKGENPFPLTETEPTLGTVTAAALVARANGGISWMSVNRSIGVRVDDRHAQSILALLAALGIVQTPLHWQERHQFIPEESRTVDLLLEAIHQSVSRQWTQKTLDLLLSKDVQSRELGWIDRDVLMLLIDKLNIAYQKSNDPSRSILDEHSNSNENILSLDALISLVRRKKAARRAVEYE